MRVLWIALISLYVVLIILATTALTEARERDRQTVCAHVRSAVSNGIEALLRRTGSEDILTDLPSERRGAAMFKALFEAREDEDLSVQRDAAMVIDALRLHARVCGR